MSKRPNITNVADAALERMRGAIDVANMEIVQHIQDGLERIANMPMPNSRDRELMYQLSLSRHSDRVNKFLDWVDEYYPESFDLVDKYDWDTVCFVLSSGCYRFDYSVGRSKQFFVIDQKKKGVKFQYDVINNYRGVKSNMAGATMRSVTLVDTWVEDVSTIFKMVAGYLEYTRRAGLVELASELTKRLTEINATAEQLVAVLMPDRVQSHEDSSNG
ncbi:hypothetical protein EniLVp02_0021 [Vibrio phage EniLVp02]